MMIRLSRLWRGVFDSNTLSCSRPSGRGPFVLTCALAVLLCAGCVSTARNSTAGIGADPAQDPQERRAPSEARREIAVAKDLIEQGRYSQVLPRLINVTSRYPDSDAGVEAHYYIGVAYARIAAYQDALQSFDLFLSRAPDSDLAPTAAEERERLIAFLDKSFQSEDELAQAEAAARDEVARTGGGVAQLLHYADVLWKQGKYNEAGEVYVDLAEENPSLLSDAVVSQRVERLPTGAYVVLTPEELLRREAERNPMMVYGVQSYDSSELRGDFRYFERDYYNVSGHVVNQSDRALRNAEIIVTIYGFGSKVFDTRTFRFGTLRPGQHRAFSIRFDRFDNVDNVQRYEYQTQYDE